MSIRLRFEKGSFSAQVVLKDEALTPLLDIISRHQSDDAGGAALHLAKARAESKIFGEPLNQSSEDERIALTKSWIEQHSLAEILAKIPWETYSQKILLLGASQEVVGGGDTWKNSDIEAKFLAASLAAPANFAREVRLAIKSGSIAAITPRTYKVTRRGWTEIYAAIMETSVENQLGNLCE